MKITVGGMLFSYFFLIKSRFWYLFLKEKIVRYGTKEPTYFLIFANILVNVKVLHLVLILVHT